MSGYIEKLGVLFIVTLIIGLVIYSPFYVIKKKQWTIYARGRVAEQQDKQENSNPYLSLEDRKLWQRGYEDSKTDNPNPLYGY